MIELKAHKKCGARRLKMLAEEALQQIMAKNYGARFEELGVKEVLCYGVAFSGKKVELTEFRIFDRG